MIHTIPTQVQAEGSLRGHGKNTFLAKVNLNLGHRQTRFPKPPSTEASARAVRAHASASSDDLIQSRQSTGAKVSANETCPRSRHRAPGGSLSYHRIEGTDLAARGLP